MMLAGSLTTVTTQALAQESADKTLKTVTVKDQSETDMAEGKNSVRVTETRIGKGKQALRDIPQSVTIVTEKLMDDRNLDTIKDALKNTAGVTFQAAEGQEEDIRLRGFSLQSTGDIFEDGMRDPAFYERDTFNLDRLEVLRGSASMLFGRGSTGGAVNQVSKTPRLMDENQIDLTLGSHQHNRLVGDFNKQTGESAALRVNVMTTDADNDGKGNRVDKEGIAGSYRWGIGEQDEFQVGLFHLNNDNGVNYGLPWAKPSATVTASERTVLPFDPKTYLGMDSDYKAGRATHLSASHVHRFDSDTEWRTQVRKGQYQRDQRASTVRFTGGVTSGDSARDVLSNINGNTLFSRGTQIKIEELDNLTVQTDVSSRFQALGLKHQLIAGADLMQEKKQFYSANPGVTGSATTAFWNAVGVGSKSNIDGTGAVASGSNSVNEGLRQSYLASDYDATSWGVFAQDMVSVTDTIKLIGGLRYDQLDGRYNTYPYTYSGSGGYAGIAPTACAPDARCNFNMKAGVWSRRFGALYQPNELHSYHISYGTSFNTSGDTYRLSSANENIAPEKSVNVEIGAKLDSADKRFTTRLALFRAVKTNERNTDPETALVLLSGKRHVSGIEIDISGRITPQWEVFGSYIWMPDAKVDQASGLNEQGEVVGSRPAVTPQYGGTLWTTYQINATWRLGGGLTFRGEQKPLLSQIVVPSHTVGDLMAEYTHNDALSLKANLTNVTNKLYADELYRGHYVPGAGRLLQVTASYKF